MWPCHGRDKHGRSRNGRDARWLVAGEAPATSTSAALEAEKVAEPDECVEIAFGLDDWGEFPVIDKRPAK